MMQQTTTTIRYYPTDKGRFSVVLAQLERCWATLSDDDRAHVLAELQHLARKYDRAGASRGVPA